VGERPLDVVPAGHSRRPDETDEERRSRYPTSANRLHTFNDVVVHAEGFLQDDHCSSLESVRNHLVGGNRSVWSGQQHAVVIHGRTLVPALALAETRGQLAEHLAVKERCLAAHDLAFDDLEHDDLRSLDRYREFVERAARPPTELMNPACAKSGLIAKRAESVNESLMNSVFGVISGASVVVLASWLGVLMVCTTPGRVHREQRRLLGGLFGRAAPRGRSGTCCRPVASP